MIYRVRHISELIPEAVFSLQRRAGAQGREVSAADTAREEPSSRLHAADRQDTHAADLAPRSAQAA